MVETFVVARLILYYFHTSTKELTMSFASDWSQMYKDSNHSKPNLASAFGLLSHLDVDELRCYLNDEEKFESMVKDVKEVGCTFFILISLFT